MTDDTARQIIVPEEETLAQWVQRAPPGCLELYDSDVADLADGLDARVDGIETLRGPLGSMNGTRPTHRAAIVDPLVVRVGDAAWPACNVDWPAENGNRTGCRNCTEIDRRCDASWKIVRSHRSIVTHDER